MLGFWYALPRAARLFLSVLLIDFVGSGLTQAFLVVYLHQQRGFSLGTSGLLIGATSLVSLLATLPSGPLVDRFGARRLGITANLLIIAGEVVLAFASTLPVAAASVTLTGVGFGLAWVAFPAIAVSLVPEGQLTRYFSIEFGLINLGIGVGGVVGGLLLSGLRSFQTLYVVNGATTLLTVVVIAGPLRHCGRPAPLERRSGIAATGRTGYRAVLRTRGVLPLLLFTVLATLIGYAQFGSGMVAYATGVVRLSTRWVGSAFAVDTCVIAILQIVLTPLIEKVRRTRALALTGAVWAVAWTCLGLSAAAGNQLVAGLLVIGCAGVFAIGETLLTPLIPAIVNDLADDRSRGRATAISAFGQQLSKSLGPPAAGLLLDAGLDLAYVVLLIAGSLACSVLAVAHLEPRLPCHANRSGVELSADVDASP